MIRAEIFTLIITHFVFISVGFFIGSNLMKRRIQRELDRLFEDLKKRQPKQKENDDEEL